MLNGNKIRALRTARNMTQQALAGRVGYSKNIIGYLEAGKYRHDIGILKALAIADALGTTVEELVEQ